LVNLFRRVIMYTASKHPEWAPPDFRDLLESAPDAMVIVNSDGKIVVVNSQAEILFGYGRQEMLGQPVEMLIPARFSPQHERYRTGYFTEPRVRPLGAGLELFGKKKDGAEFPVEIMLSPLRTPQGLFVTSAIRDISERRRTEEQISKLNAELGEAVRRSDKLAATGRMAATIAHEIKNALDTLLNVLCVVELSPVLEPETKTMIAEARDEVARIGNITRSTLALQRETAFPVSLSLSEIIDGVCRMFESQLVQKQVRVERRYETNGQTMGFPGELRQVFTNLIGNAVDALGENGHLTITISDTGNSFRVTVADNGPGIAPENLEKIFEAFFTTKGEKGTGVGLWVTRGIVQEMGGSIQVSSSTQPGRSCTCFTVTLPRAQGCVNGEGMRLPKASSE
jgi:PAS domain S-box-containing protein